VIGFVVEVINSNMDDEMDDDDVEEDDDDLMEVRAATVTHRLQ